MTSIPASRKARAITLAPRSWPSRPGFATNTRIFIAAIDNYLNTEDEADPSADIALERLDIQTPPQVPAGNAAIRRPRSGNFLHIFRLGQLALPVMLLHRHLHPVIAGREHIRAPQREHEKHMRGPHADALHLRQMPDDFLIR